jgi:protein O-GlcNAc transferase
VGNTLLTEALGHFQAGRLRDAEKLCADLRGSEPANAEAWHLGGVIAERLGNLNLGTAFVQKAVGLQPDNGEARRNLGALLARQGRTADALSHFEAAARLRPEDIAPLNDLGRARSDLGDNAGAIQAWRASLSRQPRQADTQFRLALACQNSGRIEEAAAAYTLCLDIEPQRAEAWLRLGYALSILCRREEALASYRRAGALGTSGRANLMSTLTLSPMEESLAGLEQRRSEMSAGLAAFIDKPAPLKDPLSETGLTNFYLAYHGRDDRALNEATARANLAACPSLAWAAPHLLSPDSNLPRRPRIGFLSSFFYNHSTGKVMRGFIEQRDPAKFEAILLRCGGQQDTLAKSMMAAADRVVNLPRDLAKARQLVAAERLDLLVYADIAADPLTYFLSFARLARIQMATWGHADTSGVPGIDHYLSWRDWEPVDARDHYSEQTILMANPPTCFARPATVPKPASRGELGLPDNAPFYFCPHNVIKFHPEYDVLLADLLRRDPKGIVVVPEGHVAAWTEVLRRRLKAACGENAGRIRFIGRRPHAEFLGVLQLADAVLDPLHFCGGITSLEAFAVGCPIVTLPGRFMRGRMTYGFYRRMRHLDLIAAGPTDYVELAYRLANDAGWRQQQRQAIAGKAGVLFDDVAAIREFEALATALITRSYLPRPR